MTSEDEIKRRINEIIKDKNINSYKALKEEYLKQYNEEIPQEILVMYENDLSANTAKLTSERNKKKIDETTKEISGKFSGTSAGDVGGALGKAYNFDMEETKKKIREQFSGKSGIALIFFVVAIIVIAIFMIIGITYVLGAVTAAVIAMKMYKKKKGIAKYSKMMKAFAIGWPYVIYGTLFYNPVKHN